MIPSSSSARDSESFLSRHFNRRLSLAISRRLALTSISPNAITLVSLGLGLLGAPFFISPQVAYQSAGAVLFLCHAIVDGLHKNSCPGGHDPDIS